MSFRSFFLQNTPTNKENPDSYYLERNLLLCRYNKALTIVKALYNSVSEDSGKGTDRDMNVLTGTTEIGVIDSVRYRWGFEEGVCTNTFITAPIEHIIGFIRNEQERGLQFIPSSKIKNTVYWHNPRLDTFYFIRLNGALAVRGEASLQLFISDKITHTQVTEELQYILTQFISDPGFKWKWEMPSDIRIIGDDFPFIV